MSIISEHLLQLRKEKDYSQEQMAKILNISQRAYSNYEKGISDIPSECIPPLIDHFKINYEWFFTGRGEKKQNINFQQIYSKKNNDPALNDICIELSSSPKTKELIHKLLQARRKGSESFETFVNGMQFSLELQKNF